MPLVPINSGGASLNYRDRHARIEHFRAQPHHDPLKTCAHQPANKPQPIDSTIAAPWSLIPSCRRFRAARQQGHAMTDDTDDPEIITSRFRGRFSKDGITVDVQIYRLDGPPWTLDVVDTESTPIVWDDPFPTDEAAYAQFLRAVAAEGLASIIKDRTTTLHRGSLALGQTRQLQSSTTPH